MKTVFDNLQNKQRSQDQVKRGSIRTQVLFYSLALALVPLLVLFALSYFQAKAALRQSAQEALRNLANVTSQQV
jgi:heme exporter protein D